MMWSQVSLSTTTTTTTTMSHPGLAVVLQGGVVHDHYSINPHNTRYPLTFPKILSSVSRTSDLTVCASGSVAGESMITELR